MIYVFLSFLTGISIVLNMMVNGKIAQKEGMLNGVFINFLMAVLSSMVLCIVMLNTLPSYTVIKTVPLPYYLGGIIGVITTFIFNVVVPKIPAVYIVILRFIGQLFASAVIDYLFLDRFSKGKILGGILFFFGLVLNAKIDKKSKKLNQAKQC
ncbi:MAG: hypothetical protein K0R92_891 [Lachnospiraceae bacterium]|jgi:uncharacterized membrane protein YdcZ (DUF606 family)|nr:hypothetical protein [Lachnospiraceae bacterium]